MNFKSLFIEEEGNSNQVKPEQKKVEANIPQAVGFPQQPSSFPQNATVQQPIASFPQNSQVYQPSTTNRFLNDIIAVYEDGFEKLNQPGYDFFEFYKAVISIGGGDNPQAYQMAFQMAQSMDKTVTKDSLVKQSDYYIGELEKVHANFSSGGSKKIADMQSNKNTESNSLTSDINSLTTQIELLNGQLKEKQNALAAIDTKYSQPLIDITEKLAANDIAKNTLISNINKVKNNIQNNIN